MSDAAVFDAAIESALLQLATLQARLPVAFPGGTTEGNRYAPRELYGHPPGSNVGWTTGFWTGLLWMAWELTGKARYLASAQAHVESFAQRIERRVNVDHHDMGFLYTPSCVAAWKLTGDARARVAALAAADCLLERFLPAAGIIQAWGDLDDPQQRGRIIIDSLLNLPLLHWASEVTGRPAYRDAALSHLARSRDTLVRADGSSHHTFHFDVRTGAPLHGSTAQGVADDSCWARGQAWGIYGFALNHRWAPELGLLPVALRQAEFFLQRLPPDGIACWDLSFAPDSGEPVDSSASAIAVCGLLELGGHLDAAQAAPLRAHAYRILDSLAQRCAAHVPDSDALLLHGVYSKPHRKGVDEANLWGDYFYLEALLRATRGWQGHW